MSSRGGRVKVTVSLDDKDLRVGAGRSERTLDRMEKSGSKSLKRLGQASKVAGLAIAAGVAVGAKEAAQAAIEAEKTQAKLEAQLKASGLSAERYGSQIESVIAKQSLMSGLDDEDLTESFVNLVRVTGDVNKSLDLNVIAMDFARAKNMDVAKAGELVGKVAGGNVGILGRYGIKVKEGATATEALGMLQEKFAGQAKKYGDTTAGAADRAKVALENAGEALGAKLTPLVASAATEFAELITEMETGTGTGGKIASVAGTIADKVGDAARMVGNLASGFREGDAKAVILVGTLASLAAGFAAFRIISTIVAGYRGLVAMQVALNLAMTANPVGIIIVGLTALGVGLMLAWRKSQTFRDIAGGAFSTVRKIAAGAFDVITFGIRQFLVGIGKVAGAASKLPGMGWLKGVSKAALGAAAELAEISKAIKGVPEKKRVRIEVTATGPQGLTGTSSRVASTGDGIGQAIRGVLPTAYRVRAAALPSGGSGGNLKGANSALGPFAGFGRGFGLGVTSGLRPGAITSSGNTSLHASGDAIDMAGPAGGMLAYFRAMKSRYGARLAELIYTPGGVGIKDGRPYRYTGQVAAGHRDHVHVAYTGGGRGPQGLPTGDGIGAAVRAARSVGLTGSDLVTMVAIAGAESGYNAKINAAGPEDSRGLWQINVGPGANPDMLKLGNLYNPTVNAKAMKLIRARQGLGAWTVYRTGAYKAYLDRARRAVVASKGKTAEDVAVGIDRRSSSKSSGTSAPSGSKSQRALESGLANADLALARAEGTEASADDIKALTAKRTAIKRRLSTINVALKSKRLTAATRTRLVTEKAGLLRDLNATGETIAGFRPEKAERPSAGQLAELGVATASMTPDLGDDYAAAGRLVGVREDELAKARDTGDPAKIMDAISAYKGAADALKASAEAIRDAWVTGVEERLTGLGAAAVMARVETPDDLSDDLQVLQATLAENTSAYEQAKANGDAERIQQYGNALLSNRDAIKELTTVVQAATDTDRKMLELVRQQLDDARRTLTASQAQYGTLEQALLAIVSRGQGARVGLATQAAGAPGRIASGIGR